MHLHDPAHPAERPALGSRLLAMSAARRMGWATAILLGLWACVGWAVSYDLADRASATAEQRR